MLESLRDALAIRLMAQDDCIRNEPPDDYMAHYARHLPVWRVAEHEGDCPFVAAPAPVTCMRCFADSYLAKADDLIARPLATAVAEARAEGRRQGLEWQPIEAAPQHNRHRDGSTNQPHVIGSDGSRVGEARHYDGTWYWANGEEAGLTSWMPLPAPPALATTTPETGESDL